MLAISLKQNKKVPSPNLSSCKIKALLFLTRCKVYKQAACTDYLPEISKRRKKNLLSLHSFSPVGHIKEQAIFRYVWPWAIQAVNFLWVPVSSLWQARNGKKSAAQQAQLGHFWTSTCQTGSCWNAAFFKYSPQSEIEQVNKAISQLLECVRAEWW